MPILPKEVVMLKTLPSKGTFTKDTIPKGLLKKHNTRKGTWGVISVKTGKLRYEILEPKEAVHVLDAENNGIIEPSMLHQVAPLTDDIEFVVQFWRIPDTGAVVEER